METTLRTTRINIYYRAGGAAFIAGNVLFFLNKLDEMSRFFLGRWIPDVISGQNLGLIAFGQIALVLGYLTFYQLYLPRVNRAGRLALRLLAGGGIVLAVGHITFMSGLAKFIPASVAPYADSMFVLVLIGLLGLTAGLIWFGIWNLRQRVLAHWQWLPLLTGLMGFIGFFYFGSDEIRTIFLIFRTLFAMGLIGIGLTMLLEEHA
jgi:hypothetical protein